MSVLSYEEVELLRGHVTQPQASALTRIREMILRGELLPGERLLEVELATRLNLSRTPVRQALLVLGQEGLVVPAGGRGFRVREFTRDESLQALRLRATLEGHAARLIVLAGRGPQVALALKPVLDEGDRLLGPGMTTDAVEESYGEMNANFHAIVVKAAGDPLLSDLIARCNIVPFTGPSVIAFEGHEDAAILSSLRYAHCQHHAIVDALAQGDATRVEMLFREHATTQESSMAMRKPFAS